MRKILFCATIDFHFKAFHIPYMQWFKTQGWEVHIAAKGNMQLPFCDKKFNLPIERSPLKITNLKALLMFRAIIKLNKYSIIHAHTPMGGILARIAAMGIKGIPTSVIYTAHGFHFGKNVPLINWLLFYPLEKWLSRYTDCLILVNEEDYHLAITHKFKSKQIARIHGIGVDTSRFFRLETSEKNRMRQQCGYLLSDFLIYYAAEFNFNKNQQLLIKAVSKTISAIPELRLLLVGDGSCFNSCRTLVHEYGISDHVDFLGFRSDVDKIAQVCDVAVSTSKREGLPINILEAMACGNAVIGSNNRGHRELIQNGVNGFLIDRFDEGFFSEKLCILFKRLDIRQRFIDASKHTVERYSIDTVKKEMVELYHQYMH